MFQCHVALRLRDMSVGNVAHISESIPTIGRIEGRDDVFARCPPPLCPGMAAAHSETRAPAGPAPNQGGDGGQPATVACRGTGCQPRTPRTARTPCTP